MAGLSGHQVIVNVLKAAEQLCPSVVPEPEQPKAGEPETWANPPGDIQAAYKAEEDPGPFPGASEPEDSGERGQCALGHYNVKDARFCAVCGLPLDAQPVVRVPQGGERPVPASQLTPEERAEREAEHARAVAAAAAFEKAPQQFVPTEGESVIIHFVDDGLTAFGTVWYRGQELEIGPAHPRWQEALRWILLDEFQQIERWGKRYFAQGPWPGRRSYTESAGAYEQLNIPGGGTFAGPSEEQLRAADEAERRRGRAVPAPAFR